jgi:hypothetical protein
MYERTRSKEWRSGTRRNKRMARRYGLGVRDKNAPDARLQRWVHVEMDRMQREIEEQWFQRHVIGSGTGRLIGFLNAPGLTVDDDEVPRGALVVPAAIERRLRI